MSKSPWALTFAALMMTSIACSHGDTPSFRSGAVLPTKFELRTYEPDLVQPGLTVLSLQVGPDGQMPGAIYELDIEGEVVWSHRLTDEHQPTVDNVILDAEPTADDTFLVTVAYRGIYEFDRDGVEVWSHRDKHVSHDADKLPNGNVLYARGMAEQGEALAVEITPAGERVWTWDGLESFSEEPYDGFVDELGAWAHVTGVRRMNTGNTTLTVRNFNQIIEVDSEGTEVSRLAFKAEASERNVATRGRIGGARPHDTELVGQGTGYLVPLRHPMRVLMVDRETEEITWGWTPTIHGNLDTCLRDANLLDNQNILVSAGNAVMEVTRDKQLVWELLPPTFSDLSEEKSRKLFYKVYRVETDGRIRGS